MLVGGRSRRTAAAPHWTWAHRTHLRGRGAGSRQQEWHPSPHPTMHFPPRWTQTRVPGKHYGAVVTLPPLELPSSSNIPLCLPPPPTCVTYIPLCLSLIGYIPIWLPLIGYIPLCLPPPPTLIGYTRYSPPAHPHPPPQQSQAPTDLLPGLVVAVGLQHHGSGGGVPVQVGGAVHAVVEEVGPGDERQRAALGG